MNNTGKCAIVRDLMPLVIDDAASPEAKRMVEEHLPLCKECSAMMQDMGYQPATPTITEKDEQFLKLCLKVRKAFSWKRALLLFAALVLAAGLLTAGICFVHFKMYSDFLPFTPDIYSAALNQDGLLVVEYENTGTHHIMHTNFSVEPEEHILYIIPNLSCWPQRLFDKTETSASVYTFIRFREGKLWHYTYHGWEPGAQNAAIATPIFNEESGSYTWSDQAITRQRDEIWEIRLGTEENYHVIYQAGDTLPTRETNGYSVH